MKTYSFKLYTNNIKYLDNKIDIAGIIYNHCIALHKRYYRLYNKSVNKYKLQRHITKLKKKSKYKFWNKLGSQAIQDITDRINKSYKLFFRNLKHKIKTAPPSFKKIKKYKSFTLKQAGYKFLENNILLISGKKYKYSKSRDIKGKIKIITIKRDPLGDIYIFVITDYLDEKPTMTGKMAGCDFGLKTFLTLSDETKIDSPEIYKTSIKEVKKASRNLSTKKKNSNNRKKAKLNLFRKHKEIHNKRKDYQFKLAKNLTEKYDFLFFETLNLKAMQRLWGRKVSDYGFYSFLQALKSQGNKYNCKIHQIDRFFPSSKTCNNCGFIYKELNIKERSWLCPECKTKLDRDLNASINILREGASSLGVEIVRPIL